MMIAPSAEPKDLECQVGLLYPPPCAHSPFPFTSSALNHIGKLTGESREMG
jgi:hypothetical protein